MVVVLVAVYYLFVVSRVGLFWWCLHGGFNALLLWCFCGCVFKMVWLNCFCVVCCGSGFFVMMVLLIVLVAMICTAKESCLFVFINYEMKWYSLTRCISYLWAFLRWQTTNNDTSYEKNVREHACSHALRTAMLRSADMVWYAMIPFIIYAWSFLLNAMFWRSSVGIEPMRLKNRPRSMKLYWLDMCWVDI